MIATLTLAGTTAVLTLSRRLRLLTAVLLLGTLTPALTACEDNETQTETPAPDRTPYTGLWAGELTQGNLGKTDDVEVTLRAPAGTPEAMEGSVLYLTDNIRRPITVQWDRRAARWNVTFSQAGATERNAVVTLANNALRLEYENNLGRFASAMNDARDQWVGRWRGLLTCDSGNPRNVDWTLRKASSRAGLEITNTSNPNTVIAQGDLTEVRNEGLLKGTVPIEGVTHTYTLDYANFLGRLLLDATAPNNNGCNVGGGLNR